MMPVRAAENIKFGKNRAAGDTAEESGPDARVDEVSRVCTEIVSYFLLEPMLASRTGAVQLLKVAIGD